MKDLDFYLESLLYEFNRVVWLFRFFVQSNKDFSQLVDNARSFEILSEFFLLLIVCLKTHIGLL